MAKGYKIHPTAYIGPRCTIYGSNVRIGPGTAIVSDAFLAGDFEIGAHVVIAAGLTLLTVNHEFEFPDALPCGTQYIGKPVRIHDNVWIGQRVSIAPGVTVGEGSIIGLGSVVAHNVPPCTIVAGNPARVIRERNKEVYERLKREGRFLSLIRGGFTYVPYFQFVAYRRRIRRILERVGFVSESEVAWIPSRLRAYVLYRFSREFPGTRFGLGKNGYFVESPHSRMTSEQSNRSIEMRELV
jgi:acetyltransferase-like isoleucine patch superfamily enzyme